MSTRRFLAICLVVGLSQALRVPEKTAEEVNQRRQEETQVKLNAGNDISISEKEDEVYAFSAQCRGHKSTPYGATVLFDWLIMNEGGRYSNDTGEFFCPDDGVYMFSWVADRFGSTGSGLRCISTLKVGEEEIKYGPKTNLINGFGGTSLLSAVVRCQTSSPVTIMAAALSPPNCVYRQRTTSFSGHRLSDFDDAVGFTAEISTDRNLTSGERIVFDDVITNFGDQYRPSDGVFQCPFDGVYVFMVTIHTPYPTEAELQWSSAKLIYDGETIVLGPLNFAATESDDSGSSSITVALQCEAGKEVYVEAHEAYTFTVNTFGARLTSFTGFHVDTPVAFSAVLTQNYTSAGYAILDRVLVNEGDAYDPNTGVFICPDDALYMITWCGTNDVGQRYIDLHVNGAFVQWMQHSFVGVVFDTPQTSGTNGQARVMRCSPGSRFQLYFSSAVTQIAEYAMFTGYRIPGQP